MGDIVKGADRSIVTEIRSDAKWGADHPLPLFIAQLASCGLCTDQRGVGWLDTYTGSE